LRRIQEMEMKFMEPAAGGDGGVAPENLQQEEL
jgi:hypothetical protein